MWSNRGTWGVDDGQIEGDMRPVYNLVAPYARGQHRLVLVAPYPIGSTSTKQSHTHSSVIDSTYRESRSEHMHLLQSLDTGSVCIDLPECLDRHSRSRSCRCTPRTDRSSPCEQHETCLSTGHRLARPKQRRPAQ
eukprot:3933395-Rhodomonas_salina.7